LPTTDAERIADALRAAPKFITDGATIVDYPASKGGEFRVLRKGSSEWTCLPGPPPGEKHDDPGCFDRVFFQFVKDYFAGRPPHIDRLGVAYMYTGHTVPGASGGQFRGEPTLCWYLLIQRISRVSPTSGGTAHTSYICPGLISPVNGFWLYRSVRMKYKWEGLTN
jgi:hypothetical protein